ANGVRIADQPALGTFTSLQAAIQAAPDGSELLIQSGSYGSAVIDAKALTLIEINGANATIQGQITVKNLAAAQRVVICGLSATATNGPALLVQDCAGNVRIS